MKAQEEARDGATAGNAEVAARLREMGALLEQQEANPFRVRAYVRAADTVERLEEDVGALHARGGRAALEALPNVGRGIAALIEELLRTGRVSQLDRLRGDLDPVRLFSTIPGFGRRLATAVHDELHVDTLESLEAAAHDGRLESVAGVGPRRAATVRAVLKDRLGRAAARRRVASSPPGAPPLTAILDADREYRRRAGAGELPTITPRRFNPDHEAWLPVLHTEREGWHLTLLYSNTARAHELGRTRDWVVVYYYDGDHVEGQCTVVTETRGEAAGRRVVRGREAEGSAPADDAGAVSSGRSPREGGAPRQDK